MDPMEMGKQLLASIPFNQHLGLQVLEVGDGHGRALLPERKEVQNHIGTQHAGALFTVAETASGAAVAGAFAHQLAEMTPLAKSAEITYLKIARGPITAIGKLVQDKQSVLAQLAQAGKAECDVQVDMQDAQGTSVAQMVVHWYLRKNR